MIKIAVVIKKALQDAGVLDSNATDVDEYKYNPTYEMLKDVISEMNTQSQVSFGQKLDEVAVTGNRIFFKPYTEAEKLIIAGGGTVALEDGRMVDFVPMTTPKVYIQGNELNLVSYGDLIQLRYGSSGVPCAFAFNVTSDEAEILLSAPANGGVTLLRNSLVSIDVEPFGYVDVPPPYEKYLIAKLAEAVAIRYQFHDSAPMFAQKAKVAGEVLVQNNVSHRPIVHKLYQQLNKFSR